MADRIDPAVLSSLRSAVERLYAEQTATLQFHGWPHIEFVRAKAVQFARERGADVSVVEAAALLHDVNYLIEPNSEPTAGSSLRASLLAESGVAKGVASDIENIIVLSDTAVRGPDLSIEATALSDADSLFKSLPTTALLLSTSYLAETGAALSDLYQEIISEQLPLLESGIYFYDDTVAERYAEWAEVGIRIWQLAGDSFKDRDVSNLLRRLGFPQESD